MNNLIKRSLIILFIIIASYFAHNPVNARPSPWACGNVMCTDDYDMECKVVYKPEVGCECGWGCF